MKKLKCAHNGNIIVTTTTIESATFDGKDVYINHGANDNWVETNIKCSKCHRLFDYEGVY